jgi:HK97 family phage major capsid protein
MRGNHWREAITSYEGAVPSPIAVYRPPVMGNLLPFELGIAEYFGGGNAYGGGPGLIDGKASALREQSLGLIAEGRAILARADAAARDLTDDEAAEVTRLTARAELLMAQGHARAGGSRADAGAYLRDQDGQRMPFPGAGANRGGAGTVANGIRLLSPKDRFAALVPDGAEGSGLTLADMVSSLVTGRDLGVQFHAAMGVGGSASVLVPAPISAQLIDLARNQARIIQAGATTIPMTSTTLRVPRLTSGSSGEWKAENAALSAVSDLEFDAATLTAHTVMAIAKISVELAEDGQDPQGIIERDLSAALALAMDAAALRGAKHAGTQQDPQLGPVGVRYTDGVAVTPVGRLSDYVPFSEAVQRIREANQEPTGVIYSPAVAGLVDRLTDLQGNPLRAPQSWLDMVKFSTNQAAAAEAYVGDWSRLLVGLRTDIALEVTRVAGDADGSAFRNLQVWVRAYARMDAVVGRADAFQVMSEIADASGS